MADFALFEYFSATSRITNMVHRQTGDVYLAMLDYRSEVVADEGRNSKYLGSMWQVHLEKLNRSPSSFCRSD